MIKKKHSDDRGLQGVFYIVNMTSKDSRGYTNEWWQLRLKDSHFVISAVSSKEHVFKCLETVCKRYKTHKRLMKALRNCENKVSTEYLAKCQKEYTTIGHIYEEEVEEIVSRLCNSTIESTPIKKKRLLFSPKISEPIVEEVVEEKVEEIIVRKKLPKKKLGLIISTI